MHVGKSLCMMPATEHNDSKRRCPLAVPTAPLHGQPPLPISPNACLIKPAAVYVCPWVQEDEAASARCAMSPCLIGIVSFASANLSYACFHSGGLTPHRRFAIAKHQATGPLSYTKQQ